MSTLVKKLFVKLLMLCQYMYMEKQLTPVQLAINEFGGLRKLARSINRDPAAISRWKSTHGNIPSSIQRKLLTAAWDRGIQLSAHELIFGRE